MQSVNVKREIVFGIKWILGLLVLLAAAMAVNAQEIKPVSLGARMPQVRVMGAQTVVMPVKPANAPAAAVATPISLPDWNGTVKMFSPSSVVVLMDVPVDVMYARRVHTRYTQIGPKLWLRVGSK